MMIKKHTESHRADMIIIVEKLASKNSITPGKPWDDSYHLNIIQIHEASTRVGRVEKHGRS